MTTARNAVSQSKSLNPQSFRTHRFAFTSNVGRVPAATASTKVPALGVRRHGVAQEGPVQYRGRGPGELALADPRLAEQWSIPAMNVVAGWEITTGHAGTAIAVIDSGAQHPDIDANIVVEQSFNVNNNIDDFAGHGTHVAGIIAGSGAGSRGDYAGRQENSKPVYF